MRSILQKPALRFVFAANVISMLGSGMNAAAVAWYVLQATHSEIALGTFAVLQTIPAMLMLPFTGVIIDREDRRRLVMWLDALRAVIILAVSIFGFHGQSKNLGTLPDEYVGGGGLLDVLANDYRIDPGTDSWRRVCSRQYIPAGGGSGRLADCGLDRRFRLQPHRAGRSVAHHFSTYLVSFLCYFAVRKGRHVVPRPAELRADIVAAETAFERFGREMREGIQFLRGKRKLVLLGLSWALFLAAMMTGVVVTPPLSDKVFHAGAVGYGWLNAGWGTGAFVSALYAPWFIASLGARRSIAISMGLLTIGMILAPLSPMLAIAVFIYGMMGSARGVSGVAINTSLMEQVPPHFMGRVQNTFYFAGTALQICLALLVGTVAQVSLVAGFSVIGLVYAVAFVSASWPVAAPVTVSEATPVE